MQTELQKSIYFFPKLGAFLFKSPPFNLPFQPSYFVFILFCLEEDAKMWKYDQMSKKSGLIVNWNIKMCMYYILLTVLKTALYVIYTLVIEPLDTCMTESFE